MMISICQNALAVALMIAGTTFPSHASQPAEIADLVGVKAFQIQAASAAVFAPDGKRLASVVCDPARIGVVDRSEEHTSELQSLMRISYAVFCLKKHKIK